MSEKRMTKIVVESLSFDDFDSAVAWIKEICPTDKSFLVLKSAVFDGRWNVIQGLEMMRGFVENLGVQVRMGDPLYTVIQAYRFKEVLL